MVHRSSSSLLYSVLDLNNGRVSDQLPGAQQMLLSVGPNKQFRHSKINFFLPLRDRNWTFCYLGTCDQVWQVQWSDLEKVQVCNLCC
jgi:hypothetical protein